MKQNVIERQIMWGDLDALGIVFYPRFYEWMDAAAHLYFAALGLEQMADYRRRAYRLHGRSGGKESRNVQLDFDWTTNQVVNTVNGQPWSMALEHGTQDKLLYQLSIMQDLHTSKTSLHYPIADGGKLKYYDIEIVGKERIHIELGTFDAVRLRHIKGRRKTTMWCAEQLGYLPIRIEQQKNDDSPMIATLTSVTGIATGTTGKKGLSVTR